MTKVCLLLRVCYLKYAFGPQLIVMKLIRVNPYLSVLMLAVFRPRSYWDYG